jgi:hypothetical protein
MAFKTAVITITTSPTLISNPSPSGRDGHIVFIQNLSTTVDFYIGGADVTTTDGYFMHRASAANIGDDLQIQVGPNESLYAIVATGTHAQRIMWSSS